MVRIFIQKNCLSIISASSTHSHLIRLRESDIKLRAAQGGLDFEDWVIEKLSTWRASELHYTLSALTLCGAEKGYYTAFKVLLQVGNADGVDLQGIY